MYVALSEASAAKSNMAAIMGASSAASWIELSESCAQRLAR